MDLVKSYLLDEVNLLLEFISENDSRFWLDGADEPLEGAVSALIEGLLREWLERETA